MDHSLGALIAQNNDQGHEQAIYYLSKTMIRAEHRYNPIKRNVWRWCSPSRKCDTTWWGQTINVISKVNPLRLLMTKPSSLNGRLAKWAILLSQYDMRFLPQKAVKGQAVADLLAEHLDLRATKLKRFSQTKSLKFVRPKHLLKDRCGNSSSTVLREQVRKGMS